ncbi:MAG: hypothetical protein WCO66_01255 [Candidatus Absconditabacteria bacterium]
MHNEPTTFQMREKDGDPRFPLGIVLATTFPDPDNTTKVSSLSISVILSKHGKDKHEGKITILQGRDSWIKGSETIVYYKANTLINDKVIPSIIYVHSKPDNEECFVTLLTF